MRQVHKSAGGLKTQLPKFQICFPFLKGGRGIFWKFEFGYCLLFVIWCLQFSQYRDATVLDIYYYFVVIFRGYNV